MQMFFQRLTDSAVCVVVAVCVHNVQVSGGYIEVAMLATTKICASIITTLEGADIIQQMFLPQWEDSRYVSTILLSQLCLTVLLYSVLCYSVLCWLHSVLYNGCSYLECYLIV
jgi:predicted Na+-dependent transporter